MEKELDLIIFETQSKIKSIVVESKLSPSILEMMFHELYEDMKALSQQNLIRLMSSKDKQEAKEDGEHTEIS